MTQQYLRKLSLVVSNANGAGFDFSQFRCVFTVKRGDFQTPNSMNVRIFNLKQATVSQISQLEFTTITLSACYQPPGTTVTPGLLFQGTICQFRVGRIDQLDSYVDITATDGDEAYNFAPISQTVPGGKNAGNVASIIQSAFVNASNRQKISTGYAPNFVPDPLVRGRVLFGMARDEARNFANQNNCKWSIQDGAVTYVPWVSFIPGGQVPVISVSTGLLGVPEQTQAGINVRILLNPSIKIGQLIQLNSQINQFLFSIDRPSQVSNTAIALQNQTNQQGHYYVMVANHHGDTRGEDWETQLLCLSVDATLINQDQTNALLQTGPNPIYRYGGT